MLTIIYYIFIIVLEMTVCFSVKHGQCVDFR